MTLINIASSFSPVLSNNSKVLALDKTLSQSLQDFKELLSDFEQLHIECDNYRTQFIKQQEKCNSNSCSSSEALKRIIESKDNIIQLVASTLTRLNETKDLKIINEVFKILFGETSAPVPLNQYNIKCKDIKNKTSPISIKKEVHSSLEDLSFRDESVSEIEGTPTTGRSSPIIPTKKLKSCLILSTDIRDKKKCPGNWNESVPEAKMVKLTSTPTGKKNVRLRQTRLNTVKVPETNIIDITCSPEFSGGCRSKRDESDEKVAPLIKKESLENDDTILPSPTSGPNNFNFKRKDSPIKFKKPTLSLKTKTEKKTPNKIEDTTEAAIKQEQNSENMLIVDANMNNSDSFTQDDSINLLNPKRLPKNFIKHSPTKVEHNNDETYCDTQASISLLRHVDQLARSIHRDGNECSPTKQPLAENINVTNIQDDDDIQPSMSVLHRETKANKKAVENVKRNIPEFAEMEYDKPAAMTKAEKRLLRGWACEECKDFFGELYKDNPEMLAKKINECSHHRGVQNPTDRPKTPAGFWNPRWNVPENTEEFNRKNNVA